MWREAYSLTKKICKNFPVYSGEATFFTQLNNSSAERRHFQQACFNFFKTFFTAIPDGYQKDIFQV